MGGPKSEVLGLTRRVQKILSVFLFLVERGKCFIEYF
jgi:hypothetical protein